MVYASLVCLLVMTRISVDTKTVTFVYTTTGNWIAQSGSSGPSSPDAPLVGCSVLPDNTRLNDPRYVSEQTSWTCGISHGSPLQANQQLHKKILFMICEYGYLCKYTFPRLTIFTNIKLEEKFPVPRNVREVHYHPASSSIFWITRQNENTIQWRPAAKLSTSKKRNIGLRVITFAIDNDTDDLIIMSKEDLQICHIFEWTCKRLHLSKKFTRSDRLQLDTKVYYTLRSKQVIHAISYNGTSEIVFQTSEQQMQAFAVDTKGSKVYTCQAKKWSIYNMNSAKTTSLRTMRGVVCDPPATYGRELYFGGRGAIQVVSMDSDDGVWILTPPRKSNRRPETYLLEIFSTPI